MSIREEARQEAERRWPEAEAWRMGVNAEREWRRRAFIDGASWASEQANREPSDATLKESAPDLTRTGGMRSGVAYPSDAEVEAAARGAYDRAFLKHAPEDVDRWDDLVVDNDEAAESWREVARAALLAAQEARDPYRNAQ